MRRIALLVAGVLALVLVPATAASAHPLGNFTVNHYDGLVVTTHAVHDPPVVDTPEIPTEPPPPPWPPPGRPRPSRRAAPSTPTMTAPRRQPNVRRTPSGAARRSRRR